MNYLTNYYKNLSEQLQQRVNFLNKKVKYLTEAEATPGPTDGGKGGQSPFTPGGYFYPSQLNPPQFTPKPYTVPHRFAVPGPINPGHYSPHPPIGFDEWIKQNPQPRPGPGGPLDKDYLRLLDRWMDKYWEFILIWRQWVNDTGQPPISIEDIDNT